MEVCGAALWWAWLPVVSLQVWGAGGALQHEAEEEEIFHSDKVTALNWSSAPPSEWEEISLRLGAGSPSPAPVLQACRNPIKRTVLSKWMKRENAHYLLMDISFAQEEEPSGRLSSLQVHVLDSDTPVTRPQPGPSLLDLQTQRPFPDSVHVDQIPSYLNHSRAVRLGAVRRAGFRLGFSYAGRCVLITSIRLYHRRCPETSTQLASFQATGAGSGPVLGFCVKGAVGIPPPVRECNLDGLWGPLVGGCTCKSGHQVMGDSCQACGTGFYKPANDSGGCRPCPQNSRTGGEGSDRCDCLQGFGRLPNDPDDLGCSKPPSAPVNLKARHNGSVLLLMWDPPFDLGGAKEVTYCTKCEKGTGVVNEWEACEGVDVLPRSAGLRNTSVTIAGLNPRVSYRLSVLAWNDASSLLGAPPSSTATVIIHTWKVLPSMTTVKPGLNTSAPEMSPAPWDHSPFSIWQTSGIFFGGLLFMAAIPIAAYVLRRIHIKARLQQSVDALPTNIEFSYLRPQPTATYDVSEVETAPQYANMELGSMAQLLGGINSGLLAKLKKVLVERNKVALGKQLGRGEFGSVCQGVFSPEDGVDIVVAVKTMNVGIHSQEDLHELLREAEIMQHFDHQNVVKLLGVTLERDQDCPLPVPLVILPYMKHGDLRRFLIDTRNGHVPMFVPHQSLLRFMVDVAAGMDYLSSQGFLHRDLAARNCMLGDDLRVRVADFGMSKKIYSSDYYRQKTVVRVPVKWMAVESLSESVYTTKSDVWSFGVTMWEIMSWGRTPYPGVHNHDLLDLLLSGHRLRPPMDCDHKLYGVMQSCWDGDPTQRPGFRDLYENLNALLSELPALEAFQEATYINQVLEASSAAAESWDPQTEPEEKRGNIYLPAPVCGASGVGVEEG